jgi:hypothetical protein
MDRTSDPGAWSVDTKRSVDTLDTNTATGTIKLSTLDNQFGAEKERIYLIKLDVEGLEVSVLEGAAKVIRRDAPLIMVEVCDRQLRTKGGSEPKLMETIKALGYVKLWTDASRPASSTDMLFGPGPAGK